MISTANYGPNSHRKAKRELLEVIDMQRKAYDKAMNPELSDKDSQEWMKVYNALSERRRILSGKPLPGSLKPELMRKNKTRLLGSMLSATTDVDYAAYPPPSPTNAYVMQDAAPASTDVPAAEQPT